MLTINNINYHRNQQKILTNVGFTVGEGSCMLLLGKNGSGKTSLLRVIAGLSKPQSGEILWRGEDVNNFRADYNVDIQYIGHKNFLKPKLTVLQNLLFYTQLAKTEILIPSALKYFQLEEIADKPVYKLSAGWQKRVLLAKLLCCPTLVWLLDEPTTNLDKEGKEIFFNLVSMRIKDGGIVIIATHDEILFPLGGKICIEDFSVDKKLSEK